MRGNEMSDRGGGLPTIAAVAPESAPPESGRKYPDTPDRRK